MSDTFYRQGNSQKQNVYRVTPQQPEGVYIGVFFSEQDAAKAVRALNHQLCKASRQSDA